MNHLGYLFAAYAIVWTLLFFYVIRLSRRNRELHEEVASLRAEVTRMLEKKYPHQS